MRKNRRVTLCAKKKKLLPESRMVLHTFFFLSKEEKSKSVHIHSHNSSQQEKNYEKRDVNHNNRGSHQLGDTPQKMSGKTFLFVFSFNNVISHDSGFFSICERVCRG